MKVIAFLWAILASTLYLTHGLNIMGIDLGNEFMKVSLVKPGMPFQVIPNLQSKRKTPPMLAFEKGERSFGVDAEALVARKPQLVFTAPHKVLGKNATHPSVVNYRTNSFFGSVSVENDRNGISFVVPSEGNLPEQGEYSFSAEEMTAMLLTNAKEFAEVFAAGPVLDAVFTVPTYATQAERVALHDAATLAGIKVLGIFDENTAAGVQYGIDRVYENQVHYMLLFNMGGEAAQVTLFAYDSYPLKGSEKPVGQGRVLAKSWDLTIGGAHMDRLILDHCANIFNAESKYATKLPASAKGDIRNHPQAMAKLRKNAVKAKEILSANEEFPLVVEGILPDVDFRTQLSRTLFDGLMEKSGMYEKIPAVIEAALSQVNMTLSDMHAIELIGGAVRVPRVQKLLAEYVAKAAVVATPAPASSDSNETVSATHTGPILGTHLNGDDAPALGAAFMAANRSSSFRVRKVGMLDGLSQGIGVRLTQLNAAATPEETVADANTKAWSKRSSLFRPYNYFDSVKKITFNADRDLKATLFYETPGSGSFPFPEGTSKNIAVYNITGIQALADNETLSKLGQPKVTISFELDGNGMVSVLRAEATYEEEYMPTPVPTIVIPTPTPSPTAAADEESAEASASPSDAAADTDAEASAATDASTTPSAEPTPLKPVKRTIRFPLDIAAEISGVLPVDPLTKAHREEAYSMLRKLNKADDDRKARESAKNSVEAYIYAAREKLGGGIEGGEEIIAAVSTSEQNEAIREALMDTEDWLYDAGSSTDVETYKGKLKALQDLVEPILFRAFERVNRPQLFEDFGTFVEKASKMVEGWTATHPQITETEVVEAREMIGELSVWFKEQSAAQEALAGHEEPVFTRSIVNSRMKTLTEHLLKLNKRPKPTPTPTPVVEDADNTDGASTNSTESGNGETEEGSSADNADNENIATDGDDGADTDATAAADAEEEIEAEEEATSTGNESETADGAVETNKDDIKNRRATEKEKKSSKTSASSAGKKTSSTKTSSSSTKKSSTTKKSTSDKTKSSKKSSSSSSKSKKSTPKPTKAKSSKTKEKAQSTPKPQDDSNTHEEL